ncbi:MAG: 50S ribosome-binding GTPase [Candidatus Thermoplasmatota archaeon]|nr:50S ribosome-binding GTPase [Candidatus Thermoplasmatota archaeon]
MFKIPTVLTADEILDKAFKKAAKVDLSSVTKLETVREINIAKLKSSSDTIVSTMGRYVKAFPSIERLSPFYNQLIDVTIGKDQLRKSLGAIDWSRGQVARISKDAVRRVAVARKMGEIDEIRRGAYGRISSVVKQVGKDLKFLANARNIIRKFPTIEPAVPTIVIAGAPNVGKSQLIGRISTAKPRVAVYPFTTQEVSVGTFERRYIRYQVIDTPGLLDRPLNERNPIELRAVLALKYLADVIVFILDPSETCGYRVDEQERILESIRSEFGDIPIILAENKSDVLVTETDRPKISAETGEGVPELVDSILDELKKRSGLEEGPDGHLDLRGLSP